MLSRVAVGDAGSLRVARPAPDAESLGWIEALGSAGPARDDAVERLHGLLLRASQFEIARRRGALGDGRASDLEDLAMQAANDALVAIMSKLHTFRGDSRFTTWAYKFALLEAAVKVRRRGAPRHRRVLDSTSASCARRHARAPPRLAPPATRITTP